MSVASWGSHRREKWERSERDSIGRESRGKERKGGRPINAWGGVGPVVGERGVGKAGLRQERIREGSLLLPFLLNCSWKLRFECYSFCFGFWFSNFFYLFTFTFWYFTILQSFVSLFLEGKSSKCVTFRQCSTVRQQKKIRIKKIKRNVSFPSRHDFQVFSLFTNTLFKYISFELVW